MNTNEHNRHFRQVVVELQRFLYSHTARIVYKQQEEVEMEGRNE
jgi:hypothetical protein